MTHTATPAKTKPAPSKGAKIAGGIITAAIFVGIFAWIFIGLSTAKAPDDANAAKISTCESLVSDSLVSPSTASFSGAKLNGAVISGSVDSQNKLGATVRSDFVCEVDGKNVKLDGVTDR